MGYLADRMAGTNRLGHGGHGGKELAPPICPPIWMMRQAGRYLPEYREVRAKAGGFLDLCFNPELAAEVTLQPIRRFGFDAAILFSDILVVPLALGQELRFAPDHGPELGPLPEFLNLRNDAQDFQPPNFEHDHAGGFHRTLAAVYETLQHIRAMLDDEGFESCDLIGFSGAPWTLLCYMLEQKGSKEFAKTRTMMYQNPGYFDGVIEFLTEAVSAYLIRQIAHGANVIKIFDSWAGLLPPAAFDRFVTKPTRKIVDRIRALYPAMPIIGFPKGAGLLYKDYFESTGVTTLAVDAQLPLSYIRHELQPQGCVQGNLDPFALCAGGAEMLRHCDEILSQLDPSKLIFNLGHGIDKHTPPEHVSMLVNHIRAR